mgnify:CR=1 FL=1
MPGHRQGQPEAVIGFMEGISVMKHPASPDARENGLPVPRRIPVGGERDHLAAAGPQPLAEKGIKPVTRRAMAGAGRSPAPSLSSIRPIRSGPWRRSSCRDTAPSVIMGRLLLLDCPWLDIAGPLPLRPCRGDTARTDNGSGRDRPR